jgi:hypothetical protein
MRRVALFAVLAFAGACSTTECKRWVCQDEWDVGGDAEYETCVTCDSVECEHELIIDGDVAFTCRGGSTCAEMRFQRELDYCSSR